MVSRGELSGFKFLDNMLRLFSWTQIRGLMALALMCLTLFGCQTTSDSAAVESKRTYDIASLKSATILSRQNLRFFPSSGQDMSRLTGWAITGTPRLEDGTFDMLALSSGGPDGAFGVGVLNGLSAAGKRPVYEVVTGISTGALIAPFAFIGPKYDYLLKSLYTGKQIEGLIGAPNYFRALAGGALYQPDNLQDLIQTQITRDLMSEIGRLNSQGRRLYVATANLDADELTVWDMTKIASLGDEASLQLFRQIIEAAISIPGAFAPVRIASMSPSGPIEELHGDGAVLANFYVDPDMVPDDAVAKANIEVIIHNQLKPKPEAQKASLVPLLKKSVTSLSRSSMILLLRQAWREAEVRNIPFKYANLPPQWPSVSALDIDRGYMNKTYELGYGLALDGAVWNSVEP